MIAKGGVKEMDNEALFKLLESYGALCHAVAMVAIKLIRLYQLIVVPCSGRAAVSPRLVPNLR